MTASWDSVIAQLHEDIVNGMQIGFTVMHLEDQDSVESFKLVFANPKARQLIATPDEDFTGKSLAEVLPDLLKTELPGIFAEVVRSGQELDLGEIHYGDQHIPEGYFQVKAFPLPDDCVGIVFEDITERKRVEAAELEQRNLNEALYEIAIMLTSTLDLDTLMDSILDSVSRVVPREVGNIMFIESGVARIVRAIGYENPEWIVDVSAHTFPVTEFYNLRYMLDSKQPFLIRDVNKDPRWVKISDFQWLQSYIGAPIVLGPTVVGFINLGSTTPDFYDTPHLKIIQAFAGQASIAIQNARLFKHAQELAAAEERQRLARELHDAINQSLFAASTIAESLPLLWEDAPDEVLQNLLELLGLTRGAQAEMRTLLFELRPQALVETKLGKLLQHLIDAVKSKTGAEISLEILGQVALPAEVQIVFYRIAQEAMNNAVKYARANRIGLTCDCQQTSATLNVSDDGQGFDPAHIPSDHFGLKIMRERAEAIGARIDVRSQNGRGTDISVTWQNRNENFGGLWWAKDKFV